MEVRVIVLEVRHKENLEELAEVIRRGRTLDGRDGSWQVPEYAKPGDLAVWYAASPDQEYRAYGWVSGFPFKPDGELVKYYAPVAGVQRLTAPVSRRVVAAASGFNEGGVGQLAEIVHHHFDDFLLALGFDQRFVAARELISDEVTRALRSTGIHPASMIADPA